MENLHEFLRGCLDDVRRNVGAEQHNHEECTREEDPFLVRNFCLGGFLRNRLYYICSLFPFNRFNDLRHNILSQREDIVAGPVEYKSGRRVIKKYQKQNRHSVNLQFQF